MTNFLTLPAFPSSENIHVVVETPRHAQAKFKYEPELGVFMLSRALTLGLAYPYDWGFVPSTRAPDGDPIDALVLHDVTTSPGVILRCEVIGILDILQTQNRRSLRNHRLMAVPIDSRVYAEAKDVRDLPVSLRHQAEEFFTAAVAGTGKTLKFLGWRGPRAAIAAIRRAQKEFERHRGDGGGAGA
jgi:inorganic pyrophosphatase